MRTIHQPRQTRRLEQLLEKEYFDALTYAVRHDSGWDRAYEAYHRMWAFKEALADWRLRASGDRHAA